MATFEDVGLSFQLMQNIHGLVRNMRDNANSYKAQVAAGKNPTQIATIMVQDANEYLRRIQWITDLATRNLSAFTAALGVFGITVNSANTLKTTLVNVANHIKVATLITGQQINTEADFILANIPNFERIF